MDSPKLTSFAAPEGRSGPFGRPGGPGTELIVIRHGETDWNRQHRFQGQIDVPLNAMGLEQAARLGERLAGEAIDVLVVSDLQRAQATAAPIARRHGLAPNIEPLWREQAFGILEGLDVTTIRRQHRDLWERWVQHDADYALPEGGESNLHFYARVKRALEATVEAHAGRRIAVVTHGGVLDMLWRAANELPLSGARACAIPNTGINRLRFADGALTVLQWADDAHLLGLPEQPSTVPAAR
ncbi:histidine phosphatase family protein [Aquabacterium humicola]|uniref:histidine phosphatase family protein n=1 Tax=Aquabacterium humicola TaxID=3237377 RepID=UPI002543AB0F|nr:histidine phosphatase family protein [Rubrivivax pictus]